MSTAFLLNQTEKTIPYVLFYDREGALVPNHWHKETELVFVRTGSVKMVINDVLHTLGPGDMAVILGGDTHSYFQTYDHERVVVMFAPELFEDGEELRLIQKKMKGISRVSTQWNERHQQEVQSIFLRLIELNDTTQLGRNLSVRARLYDLVVLLSNGFEQDAQQRDTQEKSAQAAMLANLEKAFLYVERNFSQHIDLQDAADELGFTTSYFARFFKRFTGTTFMEYLTAYRVGRVQRLLAERRMNVTQIAEATGFSSVKTFNRVFKAHTGMSPREYQKSIFEDKQA